MIDIVILDSRYNHSCSCCLSRTSFVKDIDEIMGSKVADSMFELTFHDGNLTTTIRLCNECLKELKDKIMKLNIKE